MTATKIICPDCGVEFLQATADSNDGLCLKCKPRKKGIDHEEVAEKIGIGLRLLFAFVFGFIFAGLGYGIGSLIGMDVGIIIALIGFPLGFVYGFFSQEINFFIRGLFRVFLHFD